MWLTLCEIHLEMGHFWSGNGANSDPLWVSKVQGNLGNSCMYSIYTAFSFPFILKPQDSFGQFDNFLLKPLFNIVVDRFKKF